MPGSPSLINKKAHWRYIAKVVSSQKIVLALLYNNYYNILWLSTRFDVTSWDGVWQTGEYVGRTVLKNGQRLEERLIRRKPAENQCVSFNISRTTISEYMVWLKITMHIVHFLVSTPDKCASCVDNGSWLYGHIVKSINKTWSHSQLWSYWKIHKKDS